MQDKLKKLARTLETAAQQAEALNMDGVAVQLRAMQHQYCDVPAPEIALDGRGKPLPPELQPGGSLT